MRKPGLTPNKRSTTTRSVRQIVWATVAMIFMFAFLAGLGLRTYGGDQVTLYAGPDHMTASAENLYIHANGHIFVTTHDAETVLHLTPEHIKTEGYVIDLRMMPDGRLLIAERQPARIQLCNTDTWACKVIKPDLKEQFENQFKVLPDADGNTLYVTDSTRSGALYKIDIAAGSIKAILDNELSYANDIQMGPDGVLWIADSNNRRIVHIKLKDDKAEITGFPFSTKNRVSTLNHTWPMMLQPLANGAWAVTQPTATGGRADILIYKDAETPEVRVALDPGLDPTDLTIANGWLLASDIEGFSLFTIDPASGKHQPWGDRTINDWLKQQERDRDKYQGWVSNGLMLMILCAPFMLVAGYFATAKDKRNALFRSHDAPVLEPSEAEVPPLSSIYWLKRRPKMYRLFKYMVPAATVIVLLVIVLLGAVLIISADAIEADKFARMQTLSLIIAAFLIGMLPMVYLNIGIVRSQLGTDGQRIFVRYPSGSKGSAPASKIIYTKFLVHFSGHTVSIGNNKKYAQYRTGEVETYIAPLLKHGKKVGTFGLLARQIANGEVGQIYTWIYVIGTVAAIIFIKFGR